MSGDQGQSFQHREAPFKGFAHPQGTGLSLSARGRKWLLTIETPDGGPYPPFQDYHQQPMTAADLGRFVSPRSLEWCPRADESARGELAALDNGFRLRLTPALEDPPDADTMIAELEALLKGD